MQISGAISLTSSPRPSQYSALQIPAIQVGLPEFLSLSHQFNKTAGSAWVPSQNAMGQKLPTDRKPG